MILGNEGSNQTETISCLNMQAHTRGKLLLEQVWSGSLRTDQVNLQRQARIQRKTYSMILTALSMRMILKMRSTLSTRISCNAKHALSKRFGKSIWPQSCHLIGQQFCRLASAVPWKSLIARKASTNHSISLPVCDLSYVQTGTSLRYFGNLLSMILSIAHSNPIEPDLRSFCDWNQERCRNPFIRPSINFPIYPSVVCSPSKCRPRG